MRRFVQDCWLLPRWALHRERPAADLPMKGPFYPARRSIAGRDAVWVSTPAACGAPRERTENIPAYGVELQREPVTRFAGRRRD